MTQQLIISQHYYNTLTAWARPAHPAIDSVHENSNYTRQSVLGRGPRGRNTVCTRTGSRKWYWYVYGVGVLCYDVHTNDIIKDQRSVAYLAPRNTVCIENVSLMPCCYVSVLSLTAHIMGREYIESKQHITYPLTVHR